MATADLSAISYLVPIFAYLLVVIVVAAILVKLELLGESNWLNIFVALIIASIFISAAGARQYVTTIIPWFGVMIVSLFLVMMVVGFVGKDADSMKKGIGITFVILLGVIFLVSALFVFSDVLIKYPLGMDTRATVSPETATFLDWLYSPRIVGAVLLIIASAVVSWAITRK